MKILVLSDTHRNLERVYKVLNSLKDEIDCVIHCGDVCDDVELLKKKYDFKFYNVRGNCDSDVNVPSELFFELCGKKFFVTHGDMYGVNWGYDRICYKGAEVGADICIFGHTHIPIIEKYFDMFILNPGSLASPRGNSNFSYGFIEIIDNKLDVKICELR